MTIDEYIDEYEQIIFGAKMMKQSRTLEYYSQLVEWLKELKGYKDFKDKGYVICRFEVAQDDRHRTTKMVLDFSTRELFDNIEKVNADENNDNSMD